MRRTRTDTWQHERWLASSRAACASTSWCRPLRERRRLHHDRLSPNGLTARHDRPNGRRLASSSPRPMTTLRPMCSFAGYARLSHDVMPEKLVGSSVLGVSKSSPIPGESRRPRQRTCPQCSGLPPRPAQPRCPSSTRSPAPRRRRDVRSRRQHGTHHLTAHYAAVAGHALMNESLSSRFDRAALLAARVNHPRRIIKVKLGSARNQLHAGLPVGIHRSHIHPVTIKWKAYRACFSIILGMMCFPKSRSGCSGLRVCSCSINALALKRRLHVCQGAGRFLGLLHECGDLTIRIDQHDAKPRRLSGATFMAARVRSALCSSWERSSGR